MVRKDLIFAATTIAGLLLSACGKDRLPQAVPPAAQIGHGNPPSASPGFIIFDDELKSGGGAFEYPGGNNQVLSFVSNKSVSGNAISYNWNGADPGTGETAFAGFDLMHTPLLGAYASTPGVDLRSGNYTKVVFAAAATLSAGVVVKVEASADPSTGNSGSCMILSANGTDSDPGSPACTTLAQVNTTYLQYSLPVTPVQLADVKDYFKATIIYTPPGAGSGGTVYFDNIIYEQ